MTKTCKCFGGRDGMRFAIKASQKKKNDVVGREGGASKREKPAHMGNMGLQNRCVCNFITVQWVYIYKNISGLS